jgi:hypothetical protein
MAEEAEQPKRARIISPKERSASVTLEWPVEFDGETYESITIRRITGRELEAYIETITAMPEGGLSPKSPMIDCPPEVYDALDADDRARLEAALFPFLPLSLRAAVESIRVESASTPEK